MKKVRQWIVMMGSVVLSGVMLAGCGGSGAGSAGTYQTASAVLPNGLVLRLTEDTSHVPIGGKVNYAVSLTNGTAASISATYFAGVGSGPGVTPITVTNSAGGFIGPDGGVPPPGAVTSETVTLQPGQSLKSTIQYTFPQAGTYAASASVVAPGSSTEPSSGPLTVQVG